MRAHIVPAHEADPIAYQRLARNVRMGFAGEDELNGPLGIGQQPGSRSES